ncbi:MAG: tripartite tricarboxylate transporter permease [Sedimentibacter saalensis]|jgi:putative tricarboxylic transport membrane protein|uniref:Putative tricarboxylic transport membrane protein n=1 Tax=Sedimentibacter saalensis TaxID=130788 RepID=A0A562JLI0_9FIRM|nr:tripartite tricarboxylate transporter permease [Sedimentibacter saalensis]MEA5096503.1 tripartite tricarboxylate transporter permease [Sedimentibacter saalensis]TWH83775.1 putative tricarboxylic transport membrane protein [Sedimentibacter saalensis]
MESILQALLAALSPSNLLMALLGTAGGIIIGAIPGLSANMGVALLVPFTFVMEPETGLIMLGGIYVGAIYGGSIAAILINAPGTPSAAATTFDGYPMAQKGEARLALGTATLSSAIGGIFSVIVLALFAPFLAKQALRFGPPEYFALAFFGLTIIVSLSENNMIKGLISGVFGLLLATIGMDPVEGAMRFTYGNINLISGIALVPLLIGLFSICEAFMLGTTKVSKGSLAEIKGRLLPNREEIKRNMGNFTVSSIIGTIVGILPGAGASVASFVAYNEAKRMSKRSHEFGTGIVDGIVASETSNNACVGGSLVPLLTLGIPGNAVSALFIGALLIHGLKPGPDLFSGANEKIMTVFFFGLFIANVLMLILGLAGAGLFAKVLFLPQPILATYILVLCVSGSFAINNNMFDVGVMFLFGLAGLLFKLLKIPASPAVLGIILGPMAETGLRQSLLMSNGNPLILFTRPISFFFIAVGVASMAAPLLRNYKNNKKANA